ncbi:MAG: hypothetical protein WC997_16495 [Porticoccaceae bacterium]
MSNDTDWNSNLGGGFGKHVPEDEYYHGSGGPEDSLTETWYWNFHVAEAAINCFAYCWVHPNLKIVTGGVMIFQGIKSQHLECELFDMLNYNAMAPIVGDGSDIRFPNGMRVETISPLQHLRFTFSDPGRDTAFDVDLKAIDVPIMRANNKHFEQVMHATGELTLRGKRYTVDCYPVRDRSWGEPRPEVHVPSPPYTWVTGTFGKDFAFNVGSHDDPIHKPDWLDIMDTPERSFKDGWVLVDGEQRRVVSASKITRREFPLCRPVTHEYEFEDSAGDTYKITGRIIAQTKWSGWSNAVCHIGLVEWDWDGRKGYGESQEVQWNDYVWKSQMRLNRSPE